MSRHGSTIPTHRPCLSRRRFMALGAAGMAAMSQASWFARLASAAAEQTGKPNKSCILVWMSGGPSHLETWDPKPSAPEDIRGPFGAIKTTVPGLWIGEMLPKLARQAHHLAIVRSLNSVEVDHQRATYHIHTGHQQRSGGLDYPGVGSVVSHQLGDPGAQLPGYVYLKDGKPEYGAASGFLGPDYQPLMVSGNGMVANASSSLPPEEFARQVELLTTLNDRYAASGRVNQPAADHARTASRAIRMMTGDKIDAFNISKEPAGLREAYGNTPIGQSCLRARRLVEVGVRYVEVVSGDWDAHAKTKELSGNVAGPFDTAASTLIEDLKQRGMLDSTLVVFVGEFGRTPKVNENGGRDHYPKAWSAAMAGGGAHGGAVVGKTDDTGAEVTDGKATIVNFLSTVYTLLGIDPTGSLPSPGSRPIPIVDNQNFDPSPIKEFVS